MLRLKREVKPRWPPGLPAPCAPLAPLLWERRPLEGVAGYTQPVQGPWDGAQKGTQRAREGKGLPQASAHW